jgi:glutamate synthase domain-containing protein 2
MRLQTYRDESHSRHFDLIIAGRRPRSIDLVSAAALGILVVGFACALMVPFASTLASLSQWVH